MKSNRGESQPSVYAPWSWASASASLTLRAPSVKCGSLSTGLWSCWRDYMQRGVWARLGRVSGTSAITAPSIVVWLIKSQPCARLLVKCELCDWVKIVPLLQERPPWRWDWALETAGCCVRNLEGGRKQQCPVTGARTKRWEPAAQPAEGLLGISDTIREHLGDKKPENLVKWEGWPKDV